MFGLNFSAGGMPKVLKNINYQNFSVLKFVFLTKIVFANFSQPYNITNIFQKYCQTIVYVHFIFIFVL